MIKHLKPSARRMKLDDFNYELFFNLSPDLFCIAGYDGFFKKINPAVSKLLGYSMEELYARPIDDFVFHEDRDITSRARKNLTESIPLYNFENRYITKSGEIVWLAWTSLPVDSDELVFAIAKDITYKKKLERERLALLKNLTTVNDELKQLTLTASHDLRSPLSGLLSVFEILDISKISDRETLELIEVLRLTGENIKESLDSFVDVLGDTFNKREKTQIIDLEETFNDVLKSIRSLIQTSKATIHADFSKLSKIKFNKACLESVFLNLVTNAIKYAKPDCPPVISIHSEERDGEKRLVVTDNGMGFDMEKVRDKIFGLHQTFHDNPDSKGIGLYLVRSHILRFGGEISVESKVNKGTRFTISF